MTARDPPSCSIDRAQANLPVVAVALVVLTAVTGMTIAMAEGAYLGAERDAGERATAVSAADRLVAADATHTRRQNVLDADATADLSVASLASLVPAVADADVRVRVGGVVVLERGDPGGGTTVRRLVLLASTEPWRAATSTRDDDSVTVPSRTRSIVLHVDGAVDAVRVDGRIVAHEPASGGEPIRVATDRYGPSTVTAAGDGGRVTVEADAEAVERGVLAVTVDD
ncbi:hypothetical protein GRS48_01010 [Halorubrum sp. JWXQ-INN 858]|uniref:DUF7263 family protein n=1 Tax=Halorubrum sp. JWXQ-INN 858 TaxID=2690782 RepID=UPI00135C94C3|nr:hypothetical protein [Halorubrum sp. JWXQ-INN 858]MWV63414.1 hypothetical protein [Halorubrum sp. JWXQ-INN 858]